MTAEIAILNKEAIALAADSAVTALIGDGEKIFTTADKIFKLSENQPVGVMVFNNAQFMGIPWETIVNEIKRQLPPDGFTTLDEYLAFIIDFFEKGSTFFSESTMMEYTGEYAYSYFMHLAGEIEGAVDLELKKRGALSDGSIKLIVSRVIKKDLEEWKELPSDRESSISMENSKKLIRYYRRVIEESLKMAFQDIPISIETRRRILEISQHLISKGRNEDINSGVVVTGFGRAEAFPRVRSFEVEGIFKNKLKYFEGVSTKIGEDTEGSVIAFAQREMVVRFMEGVDPLYQEIESSFMSQIAEKFAEVVVRQLKKYNPSERKRMRKLITRECHMIVDEYRKTMEKKINEQFTNPITRVVAVLPKSDLATLAESLVSLTSMKRRFSLERETVAEPIDVAIISRADGFVWIKKKRYY